MTTIHRLDYNCTPDVVNIFQPCSCDVVMIIIVFTSTIQMFIINDALVGAKNLRYFFFGVLSRTVSLSPKHIDFDADLVLSVQMHLHWVHRNYYIMYTHCCYLLEKKNVPGIKNPRPNFLEFLSTGCFSETTHFYHKSINHTITDFLPVFFHISHWYQESGQSTNHTRCFL